MRSTLDAAPTSSFSAGSHQADKRRSYREQKGHELKELDEKTKDGDLDIKLHFEIPGSGIEASTTEACVAGVYTDGDGTMRQFFGCDFVSTVPPADGGPPAPAASNAGGKGNGKGKK